VNCHPKFPNQKTPIHISHNYPETQTLFLSHIINYYRVRQSSIVGFGGGGHRICLCTWCFHFMCAFKPQGKQMSNDFFAWLLCKGRLSYNTLVIGRIASTTSIIWKEPCLLVRIGFWPVIISYIPRPPNPTSKSS
jgi:hypothetical protein